MNVEPQPFELGATTQLANWLERHRRGDESAKGLVIAHACERVRLLSRKMLRSSYSRVARWEQTDDVLQEVLVRLHRSLNKVQPESVRQLMALAATQIRRTLTDLVRHHFGPEGAANFHDSEDATAIGSQAESKPEGRAGPESLEDWTAFHQAIDDLLESEREVVELLWYEGLTQLEAAEVLGVSEKTIRRRWLAVRIALHSKL